MIECSYTVDNISFEYGRTRDSITKIHTVCEVGEENEVLDKYQV